MCVLLSTLAFWLLGNQSKLITQREGDTVKDLTAVLALGPELCELVRRHQRILFFCCFNGLGAALVIIMVAAAWPGYVASHHRVELFISFMLYIFTLLMESGDEKPPGNSYVVVVINAVRRALRPSLVLPVTHSCPVANSEEVDLAVIALHVLFVIPDSCQKPGQVRWISITARSSRGTRYKRSGGFAQRGCNIYSQEFPHLLEVSGIPKSIINSQSAFSPLSTIQSTVLILHIFRQSTNGNAKIQGWGSWAIHLSRTNSI